MVSVGGHAGHQGGGECSRGELHYDGFLRRLVFE